jgi:uncharacterized membrane protein YhaH (DUF805 family)
MECQSIFHLFLPSHHPFFSYFGIVNWQTKLNFVSVLKQSKNCVTKSISICLKWLFQSRFISPSLCSRQSFLLHFLEIVHPRNCYFTLCFYSWNHVVYRHNSLLRTLEFATFFLSLCTFRFFPSLAVLVQRISDGKKVLWVLFKVICCVFVDNITLKKR